MLEEISAERLQLIWQKADTGNVKIVILKNEKVALHLVSENKTAIHILSGIAVYKIIKDVFHKLRRNSSIGVIVKAGATLTWKRHFRNLFYSFKVFRYNARSWSLGKSIVFAA